MGTALRAVRGGSGETALLPGDPASLGGYALRRLLRLAAAALLLGAPARLPAKTAEQFLAEAARPRFCPRHTLPPLTRWGWTMPYNVRVQLCEEWGYALEFGGYATSNLVKNLDNPASDQSRLCALTASDPARYPLAVLLDRPFFDAGFQGSLPESTWCRDAQGYLITNVPLWKRYSPEMPVTNYQRAGDLSAQPLARILQACPISIILNGGEYGLSVYGHSGSTWAQDPAVLAAKGSRSWLDYISERKGRLEQCVTDAVTNRVPDRTLYLFYYTDGAPDRWYSSSWWEWIWDYPYIRTISDLPNSSAYYMEFNTGWTGSKDVLSRALNSIALQTSLGNPLSYNWVSGGWLSGKFSDEAHYLGFLKCTYTAGMVGAVAGYFSYPTGGFGADLGDTIPSWLMQMMALGHVHALFSHLEDFLRQGDLLPGPDRHRWSTDLPAFEFPTGDPDVRVLARKHRAKPEWLITAWAAGGTNRTVGVTIPELGFVSVFARDCGSVYLARPGPQLQLLDPNGLLPSQSIEPELDLTSCSASPGGTVRLAWEEVRWRYRLQWATNLAAPDWQTLTGAEWPLATNRWEGAAPAGQSPVFYRVQVE